MKWIQESWEAYRQMVIPANVSADEVHNLRLTFYAGAKALWMAMQHITNYSDLVALQGEMDEWQEDITTKEQEKTH